MSKFFFCGLCYKQLADLTSVCGCEWSTTTAELNKLYADNHHTAQPTPVQGKTKVLDAVIKDLTDRAEFGKNKYGTYLETNNGRNALIDAYQEALDLCMYLKQLLLEQEGK